MPLEDNEHISANRALFTLLIPSGLFVRKVIHACYQMMVVLHHLVACLLQEKDYTYKSKQSFQSA